MKTRTLILSSIFIFTVIFSGCKKDTEDIIELLPSMSATIDGTSWTATSSLVTGGLYSGYYSFLGYNMTDEKKIVIFVKATGGAVTTGTFDISLSPFDDDGNLQLPTAATYGVYLPNQADEIEAESNYYSTTGSVVVNSVDNERIGGTFSFTAKKSDLETIEITNGKFANVKIREISE